jgi:hypothetical protein
MYASRRPVADVEHRQDAILPVGKSLIHFSRKQVLLRWVYMLCMLAVNRVGTEGGPTSAVKVLILE